jgi:hypothetical protein
MEKLRQGPMLHLGVKGLDDDDILVNIVFVLYVLELVF